MYIYRDTTEKPNSTRAKKVNPGMLRKGFFIMSMPPTTPINGKTDYFNEMCRASKNILKTRIDFTGYDNTINRYKSCTIANKPELWELAKELNTWAEYCASIANYIQIHYLNTEVKKIKLHSECSLKHSEKNVSAGERFANTQASVLKARISRNVLKSLYEMLVTRKEFLDKAFYQCKSALNTNKEI